MEPLNYQLDVLSPFQMALGGYGAALDQAQQRQGMGLAADENARATERLALDQRQFGLQQDRFGLEQQQFGLAQQAFDAQQAQIAQAQAAEMAAQQAAAEAQARGQAAVQWLIENGDNATADQYMMVSAMNPAFSEQLQQVWSTFQDERRSGELAFGTQLFAAVSTNPERAAELIEERRIAAEAAGDMETAATMKAFWMTLDLPNGPQILRAEIGMGLGAVMGGADFKAVLDALAPAEEPVPEDVFDRERQIRQEYVTRTASYRSVLEAYDRLAAAQPTAAGDLSLIFNYMKMLDPGSTVREGEFANAQNATGVSGRVVNLYNNIIAGERLSDVQRAEFMAQARGLADASRISEQRARDALLPTVVEYGLNPDRVFSPVDEIAPSEPAPEGEAAPATIPAPAPATAPGAIPQSFRDDPAVKAAIDAYPAGTVSIEEMWAGLPAESRARYGG